MSAAPTAAKQINRLDATFAALKRGRRKALVAYLTAGFPSPAQTVPLLRSLAETGADVIELGIPFSDPMADGPVIQRASEAALAAGTTTATVLAAVAEFRLADAATPVVLMSYLNPIEAMGYERFAQAAVAAGADGVLVVDLPPEEAGELRAALSGAGLREIFLIAPTTTADRLGLIGKCASGFGYYVSIKGITGRGTVDIGEVAKHVAVLRRHLDLPIGVGFAIRDAATARAIASIADAVVVGSAVVELAERISDSSNPLVPFMREIRAAIDAQA